MGGAGEGAGRGRESRGSGAWEARDWRKVVGSEPQPPPEPEPPGRGPPSGDPARPSETQPDPPSSAVRVAPGSGAAAGAAGGRREPGGCMMRSKHRAPGLCGAPCRAEVRQGRGRLSRRPLGGGRLNLGFVGEIWRGRCCHWQRLCRAPSLDGQTLGQPRGGLGQTCPFQDLQNPDLKPSEAPGVGEEGAWLRACVYCSPLGLSWGLHLGSSKRGPIM